MSLPANIAEGWGRSSNPDRARFLDYSVGSASELEALVLIARDVNLLTPTEAEEICDEIQQIRMMLAALIRRLRAE